MSKHVWVTHCDCETIGCPICDGGLFVCKTCGLIEGSLTTDCPGEECYSIHGENVYRGLIDFVDGKWVNQSSPWSPYEHLRNEISKLTKTIFKLLLTSWKRFVMMLTIGSIKK